MVGSVDVSEVIPAVCWVGRMGVGSIPRICSASARPSNTSKRKGQRGWLVLLAGAAASIISVATKDVFCSDKHMFVATKHVFCRDKKCVAIHMCF